MSNKDVNYFYLLFHKLFLSTSSSNSTQHIAKYSGTNEEISNPLIGSSKGNVYTTLNTSLDREFKTNDERVNTMFIKGNTYIVV